MTRNRLPAAKRAVGFALMLIGTAFGGFAAFVVFEVVGAFVFGQFEFWPWKNFWSLALALCLSSSFGVVISLILINRLLKYDGSVWLGTLGSILGGGGNGVPHIPCFTRLGEDLCLSPVYGCFPC